MDKTIILNCQTKVVNLSCEDCIVFKECSLTKKSNRTLAEAWQGDTEIFVNV